VTDLLKSRALGEPSAITDRANASLFREYTPQHEVELTTSDEITFRGRDEADIAANRSVAQALARREARGRIPMVAELLGFFLAKSAWTPIRKYDRGVIKVNGVVVDDFDASALAGVIE